ncbi:hypothetical protein Cs7R123_45330 [Catellatospora sp. TT07R-123]|uniref:PH domain-containing protein n=1 Tax=Catellatospora sp. TT07R-123 TaxID=2733863 RepID=UPI001B1681E2|nr:PH domain-containing protein [Catellatospora sp. TT07R-123]GHJ47191.1 hypothetical protein Cs7R123_45330 [Catellatospora sp. TT07R-123]
MQIFNFFLQVVVVLAFVGLTWLTIIKGFTTVATWAGAYVFLSLGFFILRHEYLVGIQVGPRGVRVRSDMGNRIVGWEEIRSVYRKRSRHTETSNPAIWLELVDGERLELPVQGTDVLPLLGRVSYGVGSRRYQNPSISLPTADFAIALETLQELVQQSRTGSADQ